MSKLYKTKILQLSIKYVLKISDNLSKISGSATAQIFAKAVELEESGKNVLHFEIGQPDFLPPKLVIDATINSLKKGQVQYTVSKGIVSFRKEISNYYSMYTESDPNKEVIVTAGGKLGIFAAIWSAVNDGDNVIILNPSWVSYADIVISFGAEPRFLAVDESFEFDEEQLLKLTDSKTKAIIVNSPSNPTGSIISKKTLEKLVDYGLQNNVLIISDEIYNEFVYEGEFTSLGQINNWKETGIIINGMSKTFSMTGFRLGYTISNETLAKEVNKIMQLTASCATNFAQQAGVVALQNIEEMRGIINKIMLPRRKLVVDLLEDLPGISYFQPQGAIYAWMKLPNNQNSFKWGEKLLVEEGVALTPGKAFGPDGEGFMRVSYAAPEDQLIDGFNRMGRFLQKNA
jgi:aspartate/methionine/tyrosine aminotransferase